jgi:hypothetical protein
MNSYFPIGVKNLLQFRNEFLKLYLYCILYFSILFHCVILYRKYTVYNTTITLNKDTKIYF